METCCPRLRDRSDARHPLALCIRVNSYFRFRTNFATSKSSALGLEQRCRLVQKFLKSPINLVGYTWRMTTLVLRDDAQLDCAECQFDFLRSGPCAGTPFRFLFLLFGEEFLGKSAPILSGIRGCWRVWSLSAEFGYSTFSNFSDAFFELLSKSVGSIEYSPRYQRTRRFCPTLYGMDTRGIR